MSNSNQELKKQDLLSMLKIIKESDFSSISRDFDANMLQNLQQFGLISYLSSNKIILTSLGKSILELELDPQKSLNSKLEQHEDILKAILRDLRSIKSVLASLTLESLKDIGSLTDSGKIINLEQPPVSPGRIPMEEKGDTTLQPSKEIIFTDPEELVDYYTSIVRKLSQNDIKRFQKATKRIEETYQRILELSQNRIFTEATIESFFYLDAVINYFLTLIYEDVSIDQLNKPLIDKIAFCKSFLPFKISYELSCFLAEYKKDFESVREIKIGENTFGKLFQELTSINSAFHEFLEQVYHFKD